MYNPREPTSRELEIITGHAIQPPSSYRDAAKETDFSTKTILRDRIIKDTPATQKTGEERIRQILTSETLQEFDARWRRIERRCLFIFILICLFAGICSVITIIFLGRSHGFNTDYHK